MNGSRRRMWSGQMNCSFSTLTQMEQCPEIRESVFGLVIHGGESVIRIWVQVDLGNTIEGRRMRLEERTTITSELLLLEFRLFSF